MIRSSQGAKKPWPLVTVKSHVFLAQTVTMQRLTECCESSVHCCAQIQLGMMDWLDERKKVFGKYHMKERRRTLVKWEKICKTLVSYFSRFLEFFMDPYSPGYNHLSYYHLKLCKPITSLEFKYLAMIRWDLLSGQLFFFCDILFY